MELGKFMRFTTKGYFFIFFKLLLYFRGGHEILPLREADISDHGCKGALWKEDLVKEEVRFGVDLKGTGFVWFCHSRWWRRWRL